MMDDILEQFFTKKFENEINNLMLELNYNFPREKVLLYIRAILSVDIPNYLKWIDNHTFFILDPTDMPQISKFNDSFYNVVDKMIEVGDSGYRYIEIGKMLQNDGVNRTELADRKYGENHAKAAEYLGYLYSLHYYYYVSCIGYMLKDLDDNEKNKLYTRLLLRTNLFRAIYLLGKNGQVDFRKLFDMISDTTYKRRLAGTKLILNSLNISNEYDFCDILNNIKY